MLALFGPIGTPELILIGVLLVLIFGGSKMAQLGKGLGEGIRNFKSSLKEVPADSDKKQPEKEKE